MSEIDLDQPPALLRRFKISGLHGYKDVEISFNNSSRIVIAENGSGKTTILSAMAAFLQADFHKLRSVSFESIECELIGAQAPLVLAKQDIGFGDLEAEQGRLSDIVQWSKRDLGDVVAFLRSLAPITDSEIFHNVYRNSPFDHEDTEQLLLNAREAVRESMPERLLELEKIVVDLVGKLRILHLPTYRRVEIPRKRHRARRVKMPSGRYTFDPFAPPEEPVDIRYGLADVEQRLTELAQDIQRLSNIGYRRISASIIDELMEGQVEVESRQPLPDLNSLTLFLSRVDQAGTTAARETALAKLYNSEEIEDQRNETLRYFLSKLRVVISETMELESNIERFVDRVNKYLVMSSDEKRFSYDSTQMRVVIANDWTGKEVPMEDLSSGEKQVVSLFAYLYLYSHDNILLMDEPELSLSIDWQRCLLPDVIRSPSCRQLLAITHSPFIFENELDPIAGPMKIQRRRVGART